MKTTKTFSIEAEILRDFLGTCEKNTLNHNAVMDVLLKEWTREQRLMTIKLIKCPKCNAEYSEVLNRCPNCVGQQVTDFLEKQPDSEFEQNKVKSQKAYEEWERKRVVVHGD